MKKISFIAAFFVMFLFTGKAFCADVSKSFLRAGEAYERNDYEGAALLYEEILTEVKNGNLYYNLGNSYFKWGKTGHALANYLTARKYAPRNDDINENINYLKMLTKDKIEDKRFVRFFHNIFFIYDKFNKKEFYHIFLSVNMLFFLILVIRLFIKKPYLDLAKNAAMIALIFIMASYALHLKAGYYDKRGVIIGSEVSIKSGRSLNDTTLFNLHEGAEFVVLEENGDWLKIELKDKKKGWVAKKLVILI